MFKPWIQIYLTYLRIDVSIAKNGIFFSTIQFDISPSENASSYFPTVIVIMPTSTFEMDDCRLHFVRTRAYLIILIRMSALQSTRRNRSLLSRLENQSIFIETRMLRTNRPKINRKCSPLKSFSRLYQTIPSQLIDKRLHSSSVFS